MALNAYETERLANIERNKVLLEELQIENFGTIFPAAKSNVALSRPRKRKRTETVPPSRSSARIAAVEKQTPTQQSTSPLDDRTKKSRSQMSSKRSSLKQENKNEPNDIVTIPQTLPDWTWAPTAPPPTRDSSTGTLDFPDFPAILPNKTPAEGRRAGAFGGGYFRPVHSRTLGITIADDWRELPPSWLEGLSPAPRFLTREPYDPDVNKFKRSCGQSIEAWEAAGWIDYRFDARGWFQWYVRFYQGRRCEDDARQVGRWKKCVGPRGRWRVALLKKNGETGVREVFDDGEGEEDEGRQVSPVVHQTCHHWAFEVRQQHLDEYWRQRDGGR